MKTLLTVALIFFAGQIFAQVGIGTSSPDSSAVLDLSSTDKGLMLPRLADTSSVTNPSQGLVIYDLNDETPYYYNGERWQSMSAMMMMPTTADSVTYRAIGPGGISETPISAASFSISNSGSESFSSIAFTKKFDAWSTVFLKGSYGESFGQDIEFRFYESGASTPTVYVCLRNVTVDAVAAASGIGFEWAESVSLSYDTFAYKDAFDPTGWSVTDGTITSGYPH